MSFTRQLSKAAALVAVALLLTTVSFNNSTATPILTIRISDTLMTTDSGAVWMSVFMTNTQDTVAGFMMQIMLDRPDLAEFMTDGQAAVIDTAGSLMSGWEMVEPRLLGGNPYILRVTGLADLFNPPIRKPGIPPRAEEGLLFRMKLKILPDVPGVLTECTARLFINDGLSWTNFSDPFGTLIGAVTNYSICDTLYLKCLARDPVADTCINWTEVYPGSEDTVVIDTFYRYWICLDRIGDSCINWVDTTEQYAESIWIEPSHPRTTLDTALAHYVSGTLRVIPTCLGECGDGNNDGAINIGDAIYLVNYIFKGGSRPCRDKCTDANKDYMINIGDAVFLINRIFKGGPAPNCAP